MRAAGEVPGVIYGDGNGSIAIRVDLRELRRAVSGPGGTHALMDIEVDGGRQTRTAIIKDIQLDPVRDRVIHFDLHEIRLDRKINTVVPVHLIGEPHGVTMGGSLSQPTHEINVSVLPTEIPELIEADVSELEIGGALRLSDIAIPESVELLDDPEEVVLASVSAPISDAELEGEVSEEEELEGEGEEEGEEAAAPEEGEPAADASEDASDQE
jgi:large subunit ribosomal protein L25